MGFTIDKHKGKGLDPSAAQQPRSPMDKRSGKGASKLSKAITYSLFLAVLLLTGSIYVDYTLRISLELQPEQYAVTSE